MTSNNLYKVHANNEITIQYKNSSGDEIANLNFYAVCLEATPIRLNNAK